MSSARCVDPIPPPRTQPARYCQRAFPPYRFVPGRCPHPHRDPDGHRMGVDPDLGDEAAFRYGVDLFNARYFWEAHEAWEAVWRRTDAGSAPYLATKGLIQITASLLTLYMCRDEGSRSLAARGAMLLERASTDRPVYRRLDLVAVAQLARARVVEPVVLPMLDDAAFFIELDAQSDPFARGGVVAGARGVQAPLATHLAIVASGAAAVGNLIGALNDRAQRA